MKQIESFFWGIIAAMGALVAQLILFAAYSAYVDPFKNFSLPVFFTIPGFIAAAAIIEEIFKYIVISKRVDLLSLEKSYVLNAMLVGLGFFAIELGFIALRASIPSVTTIAEIGIIHVGTSGMIGYIVGTKNPKKFSVFLLAITLTSFFHISYNLLQIKRDPVFGYVVFVLLGLLILLNLSYFFRISKGSD